MSRLRAFAIVGVASVIALSFSSCGGGGGGGGGGGTMNPPPSPTPTPSICPSPSTSYPPGECTQLTLSGTSSQTITRTAPTPVPPPLTTNDTIAQSAVVHNNRSFHSQAASDFVTVETDTGPTQTITTNTDDYFVFPSAPGNILNIGFHSTDSNGVVLDEQNLLGNGIVGQIPLGAGWINTAAQAIVETDPDTTSTSTTVNADGSYALTKTEVAGITSILANADGTANELVPGDPFLLGLSSTEISINPVVSGNIEIDACIPPGTAATPCGASTVANAVIPAWYAAGPTLASDSTTVGATTAIPSGCTPLATTGKQLHEARSRLDTIEGYTDNETVDTWLDPATLQPVCERINDAINLYYDFTGQSVAVFSNTPIQTTTFSELVGLQTIAKSSARRAQSARSSSAPFIQRMTLATTRVERFRQAFRSKQLRAMREALKQGHLIFKRGHSK